MHVRRKRVPKKGKTYSYWQIVQGTWVNGRTKQTVVKHLGRLPEDWEKDDVDTYARWKGFMCSAKGCGAAPTEETVGVSGVPKERSSLFLCKEHASVLKEEGSITAVACGY